MPYIVTPHTTFRLLWNTRLVWKTIVAPDATAARVITIGNDLRLKRDRFRAGFACGNGGQSSVDSVR